MRLIRQNNKKKIKKYFANLNLKKYFANLTMKKLRFLYCIYNKYLHLIANVQTAMLLFSICFTFLHSSATDAETILKKYLQTICFGSMSSSVRLILFQQQNQEQHEQKPKNNQENNLLKFLLNKKCFFDIYSQDYLSILTNETTIIIKKRAMEEMIKQQIKEINGQTNLITQLVFDFSSPQSWKDLTDEKALFLSFLSFVDYVYWRCVTCRLPPICLLNPANNLSFDRLIEWSNLALHNAKRDFRAILAPTFDSNYTVHLNPVYRCRFLHKSFVANSFSEHINFVIDQAAEQQGCDLEWSPLYASYNKLLPYCDFGSINEKVIPKFSFELTLLQTLERKLRFRTHLIFANQSWGKQTEDLNWTGSIGYVFHRTVDMAICDISRTWSRLSAVEFTEHIWVDELAFMSLAARRVSANYWTILNVFSAPIWLAIFALFWLTFIILCIFAQLDRRINGPSSEHRQSFLSHIGFDYPLTMLHLIAIFVRQSIKTPNFRKISNARILYGVWILAVQILSTIYCARYFALLSIAEYGQNINSIENLAAAASEKADPYFIVTADESSFLTAFLSSTPQDGIFYLIGQNLNRSSRKLARIEDDHVTLIEENSRVISIGGRLTLRITLKRKAKDPASFHIGSGHLLSDYTSIAIPHKSPLTSTFNKLIIYFREMALFEFWLEKSMAHIQTQLAILKSTNNVTHNPQLSDDKNVNNQDINAKPQPLLFVNFQSLFVMWSIGLAIAFVCFLLELVKSR